MSHLPQLFWGVLNIKRDAARQSCSLRIAEPDAAACETELAFLTPWEKKIVNLVALGKLQGAQ